MKTRILSTAIIAALAVGLASCSTDDATQITYGVYASPDLLAVATPVVTVTGSNGQSSTWTLSASDFKISNDLSITAGNTGMVYWQTGVHYDNFGVESTVTVTFKPLDGIDLTALEGDVVMAHGIVGSVVTRDKDGDFYDKPIYRAENAEQFTLPADAGALRTYLIDLANTPDQATVDVNTLGEPTVTFP